MFRNCSKKTIVANFRKKNLYLQKFLKIELFFGILKVFSRIFFANLPLEMSLFTKHCNGQDMRESNIYYECKTFFFVWIKSKFRSNSFAWCTNNVWIATINFRQTINIGHTGRNYRSKPERRNGNHSKNDRRTAATKRRRSSSSSSSSSHLVLSRHRRCSKSRSQSTSSSSSSSSTSTVCMVALT